MHPLRWEYFYNSSTLQQITLYSKTTMQQYLEHGHMEAGLGCHVALYVSICCCRPRRRYWQKTYILLNLHTQLKTQLTLTLRIQKFCWDYTNATFAKLSVTHWMLHPNRNALH